MPRVAIIAGPNGSGKTTFYYAKLKEQFPRFVNADEIAVALSAQVPAETVSLEAANRAETFRQDLLSNGEDFAFETVFSRTPHWLSFVSRLKDHGYEVWLFFVCTESPLLNAARVETRAARGGHSVPPGKIVSRFGGSIRTALGARSLVDQLWLYDNTEGNRGHRLIARFVRGEADYLAAAIPEWASPFILGQF